MVLSNLDSWDIERRNDGALVVRVHSRRDVERPWPDAVFAFRAGDPQYRYWEEQFARRQQRPQ